MSPVVASAPACAAQKVALGFAVYALALGSILGNATVTVRDLSTPGSTGCRGNRSIGRTAPAASFPYTALRSRHSSDTTNVTMLSASITKTTRPQFS
jgi:hypothetical protein